MEDHIDKKQRRLKEESERRADKEFSKFEAIFADTATSQAEKERLAQEVSVRLKKIEADEKIKLASLDFLRDAKRRFRSNIIQEDDAAGSSNARATQAKGSEADPIEIDSGNDSDTAAKFPRRADLQYISPIKAEAEVKDKVLPDTTAEINSPGIEPVARRTRSESHDAPGSNAAEVASSARTYRRVANSCGVPDDSMNPAGTTLSRPSRASRPLPAKPLYEDRSETTVSTIDPNWIHLNACGMIVYNIADNAWTMTGCSLCGANWSYKKLAFFADLKSLYLHMLAAHDEVRSQCSSGSGVAEILEKYAHGNDAVLNEDEVLLLSINPNLVPANFSGRFVGVIDTNDLPGFTRQNELRRKLKAVIEAYCPRVKEPSDHSELRPILHNELRRRPEIYADGDKCKVPRRVRTLIASEEKTVPVVNIAEQNAAQDTVTKSLISSDKMKYGERAGWQCLKACSVVVRHVETNQFSLLTCRTCRTNCSTRIRTWYANVDNFYQHMATHETTSRDEVKGLSFQLVWKKHAHLIALTEEEVLRIDARPHIVPILVRGELLESSWFLKPSWTGSMLRVTRSGHWDVHSLERSLRVTLRARATELGSAVCTNQVLTLHLPPNSGRFRELVSKHTRPDMSFDQANATQATEAEVGSARRSVSSEPPPWSLALDEGDSSPDFSLDSDDPILGSRVSPG